MAGFEGLRGQGAAIALLEAALRRDRLAPAYLFAGPPGVGRGIAARIFSAQLLCQHQPPQHHPQIIHKVTARNHPDFFWVEPTYQQQNKRFTAQEAEAAGLKRKTPPQIRIEQIREITEFLARPPLEAVRSVIVLEGAETMAEGAANALLKTLEEPGRATLILIAPSPEHLLPTLVSRCQRIPFYRLSQGDLITVLTPLQPEITQEPTLLNLAQGSPGAALETWAQRQTIPAPLLALSQDPPQTPKQALLQAKAIATDLEPEAQLWLLNYWQQEDWQRRRDSERLQAFEQARRALLGYGQPRLLWECLLLSLLAKG
ncbi:DNA polymerase III subunit delta' [Spirulina sp. CCNP1310]|uniref:DNA polymerase III subunit delta' n=1 Tax=Spirulina sp. CCNP1310 TaxID=3110249 RepID=UPI002B1F3CE1|nr:DNA polymerase III subunit delta' [Spirulina sp. CCNP1310]MEA5417752.1 DNA polymerase III subunit delta' [Spirulina sp. CCNP1310]